jgi:hypothetical protein
MAPKREKHVSKMCLKFKFCIHFCVPILHILRKGKIALENTLGNLSCVFLGHGT